jgi:hypothetical protein
VIPNEEPEPRLEEQQEVILNEEPEPRLEEQQEGPMRNRNRGSRNSKR